MPRNLFIDKLKGSAIILVIWGHCLQFCAQYDYLNNKLFQLIYTFHMPFFMAVSGYLYFFSISKKNLYQLIQSRIKQLLVPLMIWSLFFLLIFWWHVSHTPMQWIKNYIYTLPVFFWFIWALLVNSVATALINKAFKDSFWAYLLLFLIALLLPNSHGFFYVKYMMPYFFSGYLAHKYRLHSSNIIFFGALITLCVLWYFWNANDYIYTSMMVTRIKDYTGIYTDCYRYIAGFAGILVFIKLIENIPDFKVFETLGKYTLGIYIIGSFLNPLLYLLGLHYVAVLYNFIYTPIVSAIVITICVFLSMLINKNKLLNQLLLGGR